MNPRKMQVSASRFQGGQPVSLLLSLAESLGQSWTLLILQPYFVILPAPTAQTQVSCGAARAACPERRRREESPFCAVETRRFGAACAREDNPGDWVRSSPCGFRWLDSRFHLCYSGVVLPPDTPGKHTRVPNFLDEEVTGRTLNAQNGLWLAHSSRVCSPLFCVCSAHTANPHCHAGGPGASPVCAQTVPREGSLEHQGIASHNGFWPAFLESSRPGQHERGAGMWKTDPARALKGAGCRQMAMGDRPCATVLRGGSLLSVAARAGSAEYRH